MCARSVCAGHILCLAPHRGPNPDLLAPTGTAIPAGMGAAGRQNHLAFLPLPLSCRPPAGRGRGRARARQDSGVSDPEPRVFLSPGSPPFRNWGNGMGGGMGLCWKKPPPLPFLACSPILPPSSRRPLPGKSGPFSPTIAEGGLTRAYICNLNFKVLVVGGAGLGKGKMVGRECFL